MQASIFHAAFVVAAMTLALPGLARAENQRGAVDWQTRTIKCKGQGSPSPTAITPAMARIGAERAAKADALRNILETLKGVRVTGATTAADAMKDDGVSMQVNGQLRDFKITDTRYFDDGGVEVDVEMPLDGLTSALVPAIGQKSDNAPASTGASTGLVVDTKALKIAPALAPRILDETGAEVYGPGSVDREKATNGLAAYVKDLAAARKEPRVGAQPTVVTALSLAKGSSSDVVISNEDARKARAAKVAEGNVVFVVQK
jgi:hypothetical protein